jgi:hypothetical protein
MHPGRPIEEGATVEDIFGHLVAITVTGQAAVLGVSDTLWELDRRGELAVYAAIVVAPLDGTYAEVDVNCPDSVPSARVALRHLLAAAGSVETASVSEPNYEGYANLVQSVALLEHVAGAALIAELQEEDPRLLDEAVATLDGRIIRARQRIVNSPLQSEERLWTLRKKASRSEGVARRRHLERAARLSRAVRT